MNTHTKNSKYKKTGVPSSVDRSKLIDDAIYHLRQVNLDEESLSTAVMQDKSYSDISEKLALDWTAFLKLNPSNAIKDIVEKYAENMNESGFIYGQYAYREGFRDCIKIIFGVSKSLHDFEKLFTMTKDI